VGVVVVRGGSNLSSHFNNNQEVELESHYAWPIQSQTTKLKTNKTKQNKTKKKTIILGRE
jgi:hypothetical protein